MIFGFNTDVQGKDGVYHVQTEDRGSRHPVVESIVYEGGKILGKKRTAYDPSAWSKGQIEDAVRQQHKELTEAVRNGSWKPSSAGDGTGVTASAAPELTGSGAGLHVSLSNPSSFHQGEYFRFQLRVNRGSSQLDTGQVVLETRWLVDGECSDQQRVVADADGSAEIWVPAPEFNQSGNLVVKATGSKGSALSKFAITSAV